MHPKRKELSPHVRELKAANPWFRMLGGSLCISLHCRWRPADTPCRPSGAGPPRHVLSASFIHASLSASLPYLPQNGRHWKHEKGSHMSDHQGPEAVQATCTSSFLHLQLQVKRQCPKQAFVNICAGRKCWPPIPNPCDAIWRVDDCAVLC